MITQEYLKSILEYNPETGNWIWLVKRKGIKKTRNAGTPGKNGYLWIRIDYKRYIGARLAFLYMTGKWPIEIDHINRITNDDRWCNLREVTRAENMKNRNLRAPWKHKKSGFPPGVDKRSQSCYRAKITHNGKKILIGHYKTAEEAGKAYRDFVDILDTSCKVLPL